MRRIFGNEELQIFTTFLLINEYEKEKTDAPKQEDAFEGEARVLDEYGTYKLDVPKGKNALEGEKSWRSV